MQELRDYVRLAPPLSLKAFLLAITTEQCVENQFAPIYSLFYSSLCQQVVAVDKTKKSRLKKRDFQRIDRLWELRDSNPRPAACKAAALNQLSYSPVLRLQI